MFNKINNWLQKPYFFNKSNLFKAVFSFGLGAVVFICLLFIKPKGIDEVIMNPYIFRLGYAINTTFVLLMYFFVVAKVFPDYYNGKIWTIKRQITNIIGVLIVCSVLHWIYSLSVLSESYYLKYVSFFEILFYTLAVGTIPSIIFTYFNEKHRDKKYVSETKQVANINKKEITNKTIVIYANNKKNSLSFKLNELLYITSEKNYACFFLKKKGVIKERILRLPLHKVDEELNTFNNFFRCHKSYIVNTNYITELVGNARGYYLQIEEEKIPVSRKFNKAHLINLING